MDNPVHGISQPFLVDQTVMIIVNLSIVQLVKILVTFFKVVQKFESSLTSE